MTQELGLTKTGLGIISAATVGYLILVLSSGYILLSGSNSNALIAIWFTAATINCVLGLLGKIVCGFTPGWIGPTTMLVISLVLELLLCTAIVCFSIGLQIPGTEEFVHHLVSVSLFVASSFCFIRWLHMVAENGGARDALKITRYADWLMKSTVAGAIGIVVAISIDGRVGSITGIIAMVLLGACVLLVAGCLILQIAAMIRMIRRL